MALGVAMNRFPVVRLVAASSIAIVSFVCARGSCAEANFVGVKAHGFLVFGPEFADNQGDVWIIDSKTMNELSTLIPDERKAFSLVRGDCGYDSMPAVQYSNASISRFVSVQYAGEERLVVPASSAKLVRLPIALEDEGQENVLHVNTGFGLFHPQGFGPLQSESFVTIWNPIRGPELLVKSEDFVAEDRWFLCRISSLREIGDSIEAAFGRDLTQVKVAPEYAEWDVYVAMRLTFDPAVYVEAFSYTLRIKEESDDAGPSETSD